VSRLFVFSLSGSQREPVRPDEAEASHGRYQSVARCTRTSICGREAQLRNKSVLEHSDSRVQHRRRAKGPTVEESFLKSRIGDAGPGTHVSDFPKNQDLTSGRGNLFDKLPETSELDSSQSANL